MYAKANLEKANLFFWLIELCPDTKNINPLTTLSFIYATYLTIPTQ